MWFTAVPVSKALVVGLCSCSILAAISSRQYLFDVPLVPHLTRDRQLWRLASHHFAFSNSVELFVDVILLFYTSIPLERCWGSRKYASFLVVSTALITFMETALLLVGSRIAFSTIPAGPFALSFAIMYQYTRIIPSLYHWNLFGLSISSRAPLFLLAAQLVTSQPPASIYVASIGLFSSYIYRSNVSLYSYRLPTSLVDLSNRFIGPLLSKGPTPLRSSSAVPGEEVQGLASSRGALGALSATAFGSGGSTGVRRRPTSTTTALRNQARAREVVPAAQPGLVQQWASGITGGGDVAIAGGGSTSTTREPTVSEIELLASMFPDQSSDNILNALNQSGADLNRAAEYLLSLTS